MQIYAKEPLFNSQLDSELVFPNATEVIPEYWSEMKKCQIEAKTKDDITRYKLLQKDLFTFFQTQKKYLGDLLIGGAVIFYWRGHAVNLHKEVRNYPALSIYFSNFIVSTEQGESEFKLYLHRDWKIHIEYDTGLAGLFIKNELPNFEWQSKVSVSLRRHSKFEQAIQAAFDPQKQSRWLGYKYGMQVSYREYVSLLEND